MIPHLHIGVLPRVGSAQPGEGNIFSKTEVRRFFLMWLMVPAIAALLFLLMIFAAHNMGLF